MCVAESLSVRRWLAVGISVRSELLSLFPGEDLFRVRMSSEYLVENHLDYWGHLYQGLDYDDVMESLYGFDFSYDYESLADTLGRDLNEIELSAFREYLIDCLLVELGF